MNEAVWGKNSKKKRAARDEAVKNWFVWSENDI